MEKILDRETKIEKQNAWVKIIISNLSIIFVVFIVTRFANNATIFFTLIGAGVILSILLNGTMALKLYFSSSSDWKKWAIASAIILTIILGAFLYLYLVITNW